MPIVYLPSIKATAILIVLLHWRRSRPHDVASCDVLPESGCFCWAGWTPKHAYCSLQPRQATNKRLATMYRIRVKTGWTCRRSGHLPVCLLLACSLFQISR
ncbi:hypothetical protein QBC45DRAFT_232137 [Copromyces sp. CBS 386.78]|nr:hypothetical protein QBC45DRAFT_232137 [Copromyces sp. CBS 386.78]